MFPCKCSASLCLTLVLFSGMLYGAAPLQSTASLPSEISDAEFWRMTSEFSEASGDYPYDNWISNEEGGQAIIPQLRQSVKPGGVYIGVGPEQNFTYIGALQSKLAFVVDIRRQNFLELFMYKALFELAPNRGDFVSLLFSRKRPPGLDEKMGAVQLFAAYQNAEKSDFSVNVKAIRDTLARHGFRLSEADLLTIDFIYQVFYRGGPAITSEFMASGSPMAGTPTFARLMTVNDGQGKNWSFLATEQTFQYVRDMQLKNLIVPVVGDFAGKTALYQIGEYLKRHNAVVGAFYISNVERYLVGVGRPTNVSTPQLQSFYRNTYGLPIDSASTFVRLLGGNSPHPPWARETVMQVVSPIADLARLIAVGANPSYTEAVEMIAEPGSPSGALPTRTVRGRISTPGTNPPRFSLPVSMGPGKAFTSVAIVPSSDGTFTASLPLGLIQVGLPASMPAGLAVKSILYGNVELMKDSVEIKSADSSELRITLGP